MEKEIRSTEIRTANEESRAVEGYALVFDSLSEDLGGFRERILPDALDGVLEKSDILALLNHNRDRGVLARSRYGKGSLSLWVDEVGLRYQFDAPNTALGDELLEYLKRGDITQSSFAFVIEEDSWEKQSDGEYIRTIKKFNQLFDISPVFEPAYSATSVCKRFAEIQEEEQRQLEEIKRQEEEQRANELKAYYANLREENKTYINTEE